MPRLRLVGLIVGIVCLLPALVWAQGGAGVSGPKILLQKDVPITITKPGSYQLGSNLKVTDPYVDAISIDSDNVTIDLAGFTIEGPLVGATGNGSGIDTRGGKNYNHNNLVVRNGAVRGFYEHPAACVNLQGRSNRVEDLRIDHCPGLAAYVGDSGVVTRCHISESGAGVDLGPSSTAVDNSFFNIRGHGIGSYEPDGCVTIKGNTFRGSSSNAAVIAPTPGNRIEGNVITGCYFGLDLTGGASFFAGNLFYGNDIPVEGGGGNNVDGGGNVFIPGLPPPSP